MSRITSLFAALCIHAIGIRRNIGMSQRIAEHRAQLCLLCLKEIQKYWRINNNVLDLFLQYLDSSIAKRLHGGHPETMPGVASGTAKATTAKDSSGLDLVPPADTFDDSQPHHLREVQGQQRQPVDLFEDQYLSLINGQWEGDDALGDLGLFLRGQDFMQGESLDFLERSL